MSAQLPSVNLIIVGPSLEARNAIAEVVALLTGVTPISKSNSESAQRLHYLPMQMEMIINTASKRMFDLFGKHNVVIALRCPRHAEATEVAVKILEQHGFKAEVNTHAEPEFPDGFLTFITVKDEFGGILLMLWPTPEMVTPEIFQMLPPRMPFLFKEILSQKPTA